MKSLILLTVGLLGLIIIRWTYSGGTNIPPGILYLCGFAAFAIGNTIADIVCRVD